MNGNKSIESDCDNDVDYKTMYLTMVRASEKAIRLLIEAQQKCEAMYLDAASEEDLR